jgi:hypothetical protein
MTFSALRGLALELNLWAHGVAVTVRTEDDTEIETRGLWHTNTTNETPAGASFGRRQPRLVMAISRSDVSAFPKGLKVEAPEPGGTAVVGWVVDSVDAVQADHVNVVLVRDPLWSET